jgi:hypothetical protein
MKIISFIASLEGILGCNATTKNNPKNGIVRKTLSFIVVFQGVGLPF